MEGREGLGEGGGVRDREGDGCQGVSVTVTKHQRENRS